LARNQLVPENFSSAQFQTAVDVEIDRLLKSKVPDPPLMGIHGGMPSFWLNPSVLRYVCPALKSAGQDVFEISKILVGVLVPLHLAGTIHVSLEAPMFALGALYFARAGIAGACAEIDNRKVSGSKVR
jgi:hypothetical protein